MTLTIQLPPDKEEALKARAQALGLSVEEWLLRLAEMDAENAARPGRDAGNLSDLLLASPFAGADLNLERDLDHPRPVDME